MNIRAYVSQPLLTKAINASHEGIIIIDAQLNGFPLIYANLGFERLTGHTADEVNGKNFLVFLASGENQTGLAFVHSALARGESCTATLRNKRKDGTLYWNEINISPVLNVDGLLTHYICIQKDVSLKIQLEQQLSTLTNTDPVAGIGNRHHFDERFANLLSIAHRIRSELSLLIIEMDFFTQYNDRYGLSAGDESLRQVGACIANSFRRTSDCAARFSGDQFAVVSFSSNLDGLHQHIKQLCAKVQALNIRHRDSPHGVVTISIGGIQRLPVADTTQEWLIELTKLKLLAAKRNGCNCVKLLD